MEDNTDSAAPNCKRRGRPRKYDNPTEYKRISNKKYYEKTKETYCKKVREYYHANKAIISERRKNTRIAKQAAMLVE